MKKDKKPAKIKIAKLFTRQYTEKQYNQKILKKLFVPSDRKLIESLFITTSDPKKGKLYSLDATKVTDKAQAKKLATIAKDIKNQKGRFNLPAIIAAVSCVLVLVLALTVFRNIIARIAVTSAIEGTFGARCDISHIDSDLLHAKFRIDGLAVANRTTPMKNLFGIGKLELSFNLLELTRGKLVANNLEITGVTWNTDRKTSGALPPAKQKKFEKKLKMQPNPVVTALLAEVGKVKTGVSVDSGIAALKDQFDPAKMIEKEKASLKSPAIIDKIKSTVPGLSGKWEAKNTEVRTQVDKTLADGKKISALNVSSIKTLKDAQSALADIKTASDSIKTSLDLATATAKDVSADSQTVQGLSKDADAALKADSAHLKNLADTVKSLNIDSGKKMISGVFNTFAINTLGSYYPYMDRGLSMLKNMQNASGKKAAKQQSLQQKTTAIERLPGRNFVFGDNSMPGLLLRNIALSASDTASGIAGKGSVQNITDDADRINKPVSLNLGLTHGKMAETVTGTVDLRTNAAETVNTVFTASGYPLSIPSGGQTGVPSVKGSMKADGTFAVEKDGTIKISSGILVSGATLSVESFEPAFLYDAYKNALAPISEIKLAIKGEISPSGAVKIDVNTDLDKEISSALQKQISAQTEKLKAGIRAEADKYIAEQKGKYSGELARFTDVSTKSKQAVDDLKNYQKTLDSKKAEAEKRVTDLTVGKAAPAANAAKKAAASKLKGLF